MNVKERCGVRSCILVSQSLIKRIAGMCLAALDAQIPGFFEMKTISFFMAFVLVNENNPEGR